jgi:hypothetical protein
VGVAAQREIVLRVFAAPREGPQVVELDAVSFGAPPSQGVGVSAAPFVPLEDDTADRGGDVSTAPARVLGRHLRLRGLGVGLRVLGLDFRLLPALGVRVLGFGLGLRFPCRLRPCGRATGFC